MNPPRTPHTHTQKITHASKLVLKNISFLVTRRRTRSYDKAKVAIPRRIRRVKLYKQVAIPRRIRKVSGGTFRGKPSCRWCCWNDDNIDDDDDDQETTTTAPGIRTKRNGQAVLDNVWAAASRNS